MTITRHEQNKVFSKVVEANGFVITSGITADDNSLDVKGQTSERAAWSYPDPSPAFAAIKDYLAFYASRADECWIGEERVQAQAGDFYGGWISSRVVGPFKGSPGTQGW